MTRERRDFGFWRALGTLRFRQVFGRIELGLAIIFGVGGGILAAQFTPADQRITTAGDFQALLGALAGVVFAGFSLVVGLMSDRYALWLKAAPDGIPGFLGPFLIGTGLQIFSLLLSVSYRLAAKALPSPWETIAFGFVVAVFVYAALDVLALARTVFAHAVTKAEVAEIESLEQQAQRIRAKGARPELGGR